MYLITYNFTKCISHGKKLLAFESASTQSKYNVHMYLAEAHCMLGKFKESYEQLDEAEKMSGEESFVHATDDEQNQVYNVIHQVEHKFRKINVISSDSSNPASKDMGLGWTQDEVLTVKIINKLNRCVVDICQGNFDLARQKFDEVITSTEENGGLGLKEITIEGDNKQMLPAYLVTLLVYFYLRVKNLKMARALIKSRRFVIDTDHIVQQVKLPTAQNSTDNSAGGN
jgi:hypothetical protein